ncbi:DUF6518 family protein [Blastococcus xanthinilyticus]|uniref:Uncharacterized protein n=1 Tax=Blastococcus xanthinilyticus TaxID=1564164 RepID=A0A5S5CSU6_9ACTN|nr:DUF6518 family protein [Blastococcus xanthinilyticus]TYP86830.1 hypothetical protein BD833_108115 [Blastococcus xanthinilyticus]
MTDLAEPTAGTTAPPSRRGELRRLCGFAVLGALAGVAAKLGDESGWQWAGDLGTYPAAWVLVVALIGRFAPGVGTAAVRAAVFFAAMTAAYYSWAVFVLGFGYQPALIAAWLLLSASAVAAFAAVVSWAARRPGPLAGAVLALAAGTALVNGALRGVWLVWTGSAVVLHPVQAVAEVVVVLVVVLVLPRHRSTRLWALGLLLPMAWLAQELVNRLLYDTGVI